jgi:hypothetical protein
LPSGESTRIATTGISKATIRMAASTHMDRIL